MTPEERRQKVFRGESTDQLDRSFTFTYNALGHITAIVFPPEAGAYRVNISGHRWTREYLVNNLIREETYTDIPIGVRDEDITEVRVTGVKV